ncbi:MAG: Nif3-like dinuclear metal center hexameric protein [Planctomycetota bacterium]
MTGRAVVTLDAALAALQRIAPLELAAEWDNVGLLVDPRGSRRRRVARVLLTIDLTAAVAREARAFRADLVVAYHPVIFQPLRRLSAKDGKQGAVLELAAAGCAVWSPHTALDAVPGGVADWLADGVLAGDEAKSREPCGEGDFGRVVALPRDRVRRTRAPLQALPRRANVAGGTRRRSRAHGRRRRRRRH